MRLWSLHPSFLDSKGLVALWREALLAQNVLYGKTKAYSHHPQMQRFQRSSFSKEAMHTYLNYVYEEAKARGYNFNKNKILGATTKLQINVTIGQLKFEFEHLKNKLITRDLDKFKPIDKMPLKANPLFNIVDGDIEEWERI